MNRSKAQVGFFHFIAAVNALLPKRHALLFHSFPDLDDQLVSVLRRLAAPEMPAVPVTILVSGNPAAVRRRLALLVGGAEDRFRVLGKQSFAGIWAYWRSRFVFITHGLYLSRWRAPGQVVVNLWHGMPIKRVWSRETGDPAPACTWLLSTSSRYSALLAEISGIAVASIPPIGLPRNDLLFSSTENVRRFSQKMRQGADRVILFLPTYRKSKVGFITQDGRETDNPIGMKPAELERFRQFLAQTRTRVLVKPHPMSVHYGIVKEWDEWLWTISDEWLHEQKLTLYEALGQVDALITDISSVYVDFLSRDRPIFFYFPDLAEYGQKRNFLFEPIEEWLAGPLLTDIDALLVALREFCNGIDTSATKRRHIADLLNPQVAPGAVDQLFHLTKLGP